MQNLSACQEQEDVVTVAQRFINPARRPVVARGHLDDKSVHPPVHHRTRSCRAARCKSLKSVEASSQLRRSQGGPQARAFAYGAFASKISFFVPNQPGITRAQKRCAHPEMAHDLVIKDSQRMAMIVVSDR